MHEALEPTQAGWVLSHEGYNLLTESAVESRLAFGNGFLGMRAALRTSELVDLRWNQVDFRTATLHVRRVKQGTPSTHPILGTNYARYGAYSASRSQGHRSYSHRNGGAPFTTAGFARTIERAGKVAKLAFKAHPCPASARVRQS